MTEKQVEKKLVDGVKHLGGIAYKFVSPGNAGVPDRIVVLPGGWVIFVELKTETGKLSAIQQRQLRRLIDRDAQTWVLYGEADVQDFLKYWGNILGKKI